MQTAADWLAAFTVVGVPPFILFWFFVHPFTRRWRSLGSAKAYLILCAILVAIMLILYQFRVPLLRVHFGVSWPLTALAAVLFLVSLALGMLRTRRLGATVMIGVPQLSDCAYPGALVTDGVYSYLRHPRYVEAGLGLVAVALFTNYLSVYVIAAAYIPTMYLVVLLEERELRDRFGTQYEDYATRVPRFFPRIARRRRSDS
jgi:protein-S-isoprenylcysteine O-methyltransferase Ste14